jgi:formyltetrahydrofolate deformylase
MNMTSTNDYILTLSCPDRMGIVHGVSGLLLQNHGNIIDAQQYGDEQRNQFFLRIHFTLASALNIEPLQHSFVSLSKEFDMSWKIYNRSVKSKVLILVSKQGNCLNNLLFRVRNQQLHADIVGVVSNHPDFEGLVASYGIPFYYLPVSSDTRAKQEAEILRLVQESETDLVVLARYMQILSPSLCQALAGRAINIHHSFLPSFKGARPYYQAHAKGVKIIGATAHYVTHDLDEGPIIEQDIERVDHTMSAHDLTEVGSDVESRVLARAVGSHVEHRILLNGKKTVVFK